ncbi:MAG: DEAD/DEAH box helicase [Acidimicrobiia bacterium]|nr:DEAD/DEAH box helicase [Acidimicrobiia bacterium]
MSELDLFTESTRAWFSTTFAAPTPAQTGGWDAIAKGSHTLIHAPTGSGKTLAAFLWGIDQLFADPSTEEKTRLLYVSPLKALAYDIERNLRAPLVGIANAAAREGLTLPELRVGMRTGDTPQQERRRLHAHPPDVLITTPESLYLMLTSRVRETLGSVQWVIIDEVHAVAGTKRGAHLALSLERLEELADQPQRIGLSATQRPLSEIARFIGGGDPDGTTWRPRPVVIVDSPKDKELDVEVVVPVRDMTDPAAGRSTAREPAVRSIWPTMYERLVELINENRSTIVFANSRGIAERIARQINDLAGEELARAHHGSVSREQRLDIEDKLKRGDIKCVIATSTLELGVDMAAVDMVIMVETPPSVASAMQRVGRAGHQVGAPSRARLFPKHRADLLEAAVVVDRMHKGAIESTTIPRNPLDVLAQQIVAAVAMDEWDVDALYQLVRRAAPYAELGRGPFEATLDMLAGRYPSDEFAELRPRITWDRINNTLQPRPGAHLLAVTNPGTIPDRGLYRVVLPEGGKVGELDEEMVYESRPGDVFLLGSSTWQIAEIDHDRVIVAPAPAGSSPRLPFWHGDAPGRPLELGQALGQFLRELAAEDQSKAEHILSSRYRLDDLAARNLAAYIAEEKAATGTVPSDRTLVIQRFRDEIGDWRIVLLSPLGARVHAPWALAASRKMRLERGIEADGLWTDDGIIFRFPDADTPPDTSALLVDAHEIEELVTAEVAESTLFASRFREAAARALLLPRRGPDKRTPLWLQRRKSSDLLAVARKYGSFPIVLETYREVLQDHFDLPATKSVLGDIAARRIRVVDVDGDRPSPFAASLLFDFIATFMYEYDSPAAERKATALTLDRDLLAELLGEPELRSLLDAGAIESVELELQRLQQERKARGVDGIHDLLRHLGPLSTDEIRARTTSPDEADADLTQLAQSGRAFKFGALPERWAAAEDASRLRDALGIAIPRGIPQEFTDSVADPLGDVVGRYARTHAPFTTGEAATALGLAEAVVATTLERLTGEGRVVVGAFRPNGTDKEWCEVDVLRRIRRRSLAVLRSEAEAVPQAALARLVPQWQGVGSRASGGHRLAEIVRTLQGASVPASILEGDVLGSRMSYSPDELDQLCASGELVWVGRGPIGAKDGRVSLYLPDQIALLAPAPPAEVPDSELHDSLRHHLGERGASFFRDLYTAAGGGDQQTVIDAIWDLVWAGELTNDTFAPLRAFLWGKVRSSGRRPRLPSASSPPAASGRWYLVSDLISSSPTDTERAAAIANQLLERHGVLTRDAVVAEGVPGGFSGLYPVLRAMEDAGKVRRGYFVEGLGGAQFSIPGALDRIRHIVETGAVVLAAADPANPYGHAISWPDNDGSVGRRSGAYVVLVEGELAAFIERGGRRIVTFTTDDTRLQAVAGAIVDLAKRKPRRMELELVDGERIATSPLGRMLAVSGFRTSYKGLVLKD